MRTNGRLLTTRRSGKGPDTCAAQHKDAARHDHVSAPSRKSSCSREASTRGSRQPRLGYHRAHVAYRSEAKGTVACVASTAAPPLQQRCLYSNSQRCLDNSSQLFPLKQQLAQSPQQQLALPLHQQQEIPLQQALSLQQAVPLQQAMPLQQHLALPLQQQLALPLQQQGRRKHTAIVRGVDSHLINTSAERVILLNPTMVLPIAISTYAWTPL